jgi:tetratricopeptide (TPR) repeat protein
MNKLLRHSFLLITAVMFMSSCASLRQSKKSKLLTFQQKSRFDQAYFEASKLKVLGDFTGSAKLFADALKIDPSSHASMYQIANLNMAIRSFHEAIYWSEKSIEFNRSYNFWYYGQLAQAYSKVSDFNKSAETFKTMMSKDPERKSNYIEAGNQFINARNFKSAISIFNVYQKKFGIDEESARKKEELYFEIGKPAEALASMIALVKAYPDEVRFRGLLAEAYVRNKQYPEAIETYEKILENDSENGFAHFGLADVYRRMDEKDLSFDHLSKAFNDANVSLPLKIKVMGSFYPYIRDNEKMRNQALELGQKLVDKHPLETEAYLAYSDVLYAAGEPEKARKNLLKAIQVDPSNMNVWRKILSLDDELVNFNYLVEDSKNALELFPNHSFLYIVNAYGNYAIGDYASAQNIAAEGLEISVIPQDRIDLLSTLADASHELGDHKKSDDAFDELLELDPENEGALNNYAYYLSLRKVKLELAMKMIKKALEISPNQLTYVDTYGWILYQMGSYEQALTILKQAYESMSDEAEVVEHYALALIKTGNDSKGQELLKRVEKLQEENQIP